MADCAICGAPNAELFTTHGELACRTCYYREQTAVQEQRAREAAVEQFPSQMQDIARRVQDKAAEQKNKRPPPPPGTSLRRGLIVLAVGSLATVGWAVLMGEIAIPFVLIAGVGFAWAARGYRVRHYE